MTLVVTPPQVPDLLGTAPADLIDKYAQAPVATRDVAVRRAERSSAGESGMHQRFAAARCHGEWFEATPDLVAYIAQHAASVGVR